MTEERQTAGELSKKAWKDNTKYDALEVGHAMADDIMVHLRESISKHYHLFDENEFCVVMVIAKDPLIENLIRRKFYCWPFLPKPRPNQAVFYYTKHNDELKRLWVLPSDMVMSELAGTNIIVHKRYETMQAWSVAFFKGTFWEYIRHESKIDMPSEKEYFLANREKLIQAGGHVPNSDDTESFDFSKIQVNKVVDTETTVFA